MEVVKYTKFQPNISKIMHPRPKKHIDMICEYNVVIQVNMYLLQIARTHVPSNLQEVQLKILNDSVCYQKWGRIAYGKARLCAGENSIRKTLFKVITFLYYD